jgi:hypothetical protein
MKRMMLVALVVALVGPGCIVAVESRPPRTYSPPPQPPPPPPPAQVTVEWHDARTVVLREYYECDWDSVGAFEYYEDTCGIPEDDLFFLLHVSRITGSPFHEVVFTYNNNCNRVLWNVCLHYRFNYWDLYVDLPAGTVCPPAYHRAYGYYWRRDRSIVLTNYDCHALFWLKFSVNYYGWQPRECFTRWDNCVDNRTRYVTVVHREYNYAGRGGYNWNRRPVVKVIERPEKDTKFIVHKRVEVVKKVEIDCNSRAAQGQKVVRPPSRDEKESRLADFRRKQEDERRRESEERKREPQKYHDAKRDDNDDHKDDRKDDKKDDKKDDRRNPPPPPPKHQPPPKNDGKKDDGKKDDGKKDDGKKDDRKGEDRRDDRKGRPEESAAASSEAEGSSRRRPRRTTRRTRRRTIARAKTGETTGRTTRRPERRPEGSASSAEEEGPPSSSPEGREEGREEGRREEGREKGRQEERQEQRRPPVGQLGNT